MRHGYALAVKVETRMLAIFPTSATFPEDLGVNLFVEHTRKEGAAVLYNRKILSPGNAAANAYRKELRP